jgi:hypothetical protein
MNKLLKVKDFPLDYPKELVDIFESLSLTNLKDFLVLGSSSIRSQLYPSDYDCFENIKNKNIDKVVKKFQSNIKKLSEKKDIFIGDIKCGEVKDLEVIPSDYKFEKDEVIGYSIVRSRMKLNNLKELNLISEKDFLEYIKVINKYGAHPTPAEFLELHKLVRPQVQRWTIKEVLAGHKKLNNGTKFTLKEGFLSDGLTKVDIVALLQKVKYTDISVIYNLEKKDSEFDIEKDLKEDVLYYLYNKNYFKLAKRLYSIAKYKEENNVIKKLSLFLNGDLGRIYSIYSEVETLLYLLENQSNLSLDKIKYEIDNFKYRMSNIYSLDKYLSVDNEVNRNIKKLVELPNSKLNRKILIEELEELKDFFFNLLNYYSKKDLQTLKLYPINKKYLP